MKKIIMMMTLMMCCVFNSFGIVKDTIYLVNDKHILADSILSNSNGDLFYLFR
jgi:hypothetical protein